MKKKKMQLMKKDWIFLLSQFDSCLFLYWSTSVGCVPPTVHERIVKESEDRWWRKNVSSMKCLEEFVERHKWKPQPDTVKGNDILARCTSTMCLDTIYNVYIRSITAIKVEQRLRKTVYGRYSNLKSFECT